MRTRLSLLAVALACAAPRPQPPRGEEVLRVEGQVENAPFVFGTDDLPALPRRTFESVGPSGDGARHRYEGVALDLLLQEDRMELMRAADTVVVHAADGRVAPIPLAVVRELRPILADHVDGRAVPHDRRGPALVLAWPISEHPGAQTDPRLRSWWLSDVHRVDVQAWEETYGRALQVPSGASDDARLGAGIVEARCIGCHAVRGVGGTRAPALTRDRIVDGLRAPPASLHRHVREVTAAGDGVQPEPGAVRKVIAFLTAVHLSGPEPLPVTKPSPPPDEEPLAPPGLGR